MKRKINSGHDLNKGFTLVEVIISIGFLFIACGIIIQLFIASGQVRSKTALVETAALKVANAIEACKLSDSPADAGKGIFNPVSTHYEKTEKGYVIREYFSENWGKPLDGITPVFVVKTEISEIRNIPDTMSGFGGSQEGDVIVSGLYEIKVTAGYTDTGREDSVLADYSTMHHYVYAGDGE